MLAIWAACAKTEAGKKTKRQKTKKPKTLRGEARRATGSQPGVIFDARRQKGDFSDDG
jgi:hypothetical protein